jgi:hypothetical protein
VERYLTKEEIKRAKENGISYDNLYNRVYNLGWELEKAVTTPLQKGGGLWPKWKHIATEHDIKGTTFLNRIRFQGMTPEEAATKPITPPSERAREANKKRKYKAKITPEIRAKAEANGISYARLGQRVYRLKWDIERACTEPIGTVGFVFGKQYK